MILTKRQKKILMILGIVALAFIIFIYFIYIPMKSRATQLNGEIRRAQSELDEIRRAIEEGTSLEKAIGIFREKLDAIDRKFPEKEEVVIRELPNFVLKTGVELVNIRVGNKTPINEIGRRSIGVQGCFVQEVPISLSVKTTYRGLGDFLAALKTQLPLFVRIEDVRINKAGEGFVTADINMYAYLFCPIPK